MAIATTTPDGELAVKSDHGDLEEAGVAFDPTTQMLDLNKEEKRRTTALLMAISAYKELIIKDAEYLRVATDNARRGDGPQIKAATIDAMIEAAFRFDVFIAGEELKVGQEQTGGSQTETADEAIK